MGFAAEITGRTGDAYKTMAQKAKDPGLREILQTLSVERGKSHSLMEMTRRENVTEMILEPITGLQQEDYEIDLKVTDPMPGVDHEALIAELKGLLPEAEFEVFANSHSVWSPPEHEWVQRVFEICEPILGQAPQTRTATYMTDAANLRKVYGSVPTVVLGPGEAAMAHQTDEYCHLERIRQSVQIYEDIIRDWCGA